MAKNRNILGNRHKKNAEHLARTETYVRKIRQVFDLFSKKAAKLATSVDYNPEEEFKWDDFPAIKARVNQLTKDFAKSLNLTVTDGIKGEWEAANNVHDDTLKRFFEAHTYTQQKKKGVRHYFEYNKDAVQNFIDRKTKGLSLSERLWNLRGEYKDELEAAIATGIEKGTSAVQLSKQISQYLNDFYKLKDDYTEKFGKQADIKNCEYKAARLARTEINMSYREAEQARWREEDFVVGYEIKRSGTPYPCPVCESLAGKYPKDFKWNGWHPNCRCYQVPILKTEEEFWKDEGESATSINKVKYLPDNFREWVNDNEDRIESAKDKNTVPFFLTDNRYLIRLPDTLEKELGVTKSKFSDYISSLASDLDILSFKRDVFDIFESNGIDTSSIKAKISLFNDGGFILTMQGKDLRLDRIFGIVGNGELVCMHERFRLPEDKQKLGIGRKIMRLSYLAYKRMGVDRIKLQANLESGGLVWAKYGFYSVDRISVQKAVNGLPHEKEFLKIVERYYSGRGLADKEPFPMRLLSDKEWSKELLGMGWEGVLDMNSKEQCSFFERHLGL